MTTSINEEQPFNSTGSNNSSANLPSMSKDKYMTTYENFLQWKKCCGPGVQCILLDKTADIQTTPRIVFMPPTKVTVESKHNQGWYVEPDHSQWDVLMLTLRISRFFGVAPVRFQKDYRGCPATVSKAENTYSYSKLLTIIIHVCLLLGTVIDINVGEKGLRCRGSWTCFCFISESFLLITTTSVGAFCARDRLEKTFKYLNAIDKITADIGRPRVYRNTKINSIATVLYLTCVIILLSADFYVFFRDSFMENRDYYLMFLYISIYAEIIIAVLLKLQFMLVAMYVHSGLKCINNAMQDLIYFIDAQKSQQFKSSKYVPESIRKFSLSYGTICDVVAGINDDYGLLSLLFVVKFILNFVYTPLNLLIFLNSRKPRRLNMIVQIFFVIFHISQMSLVLEPGYWTEKQNEKMQTLTRQLMQRVSSPQDPMLAELDLMLKLINLSNIYYSPLKFCKLRRSLITAILGGATTYLVIILQYQQTMGND